MSKILMIVTGHGEIDAEHRTGLWYDEFAIPYAAFREQGFDVTTATPLGGKAPVDPRSLEGVDTDREALDTLAHTTSIRESGDASIHRSVGAPRKSISALASSSGACSA